jgi:hypothetical protein
MKFSISSLVSTLDPYQPSSFAVGLDMGVSGLIPGPKWKMSCNNLIVLPHYWQDDVSSNRLKFYKCLMIFQRWNWYIENYSIVQSKPGILNNYIRIVDNTILKQWNIIYEEKIQILILWFIEKFCIVIGRQAGYIKLYPRFDRLKPRE